MEPFGLRLGREIVELGEDQCLGVAWAIGLEQRQDVLAQRVGGAVAAQRARRLALRRTGEADEIAHDRGSGNVETALAGERDERGCLGQIAGGGERGAQHGGVGLGRSLGEDQFGAGDGCRGRIGIGEEAGIGGGPVARMDRGEDRTEGGTLIGRERGGERERQNRFRR